MGILSIGKKSDQLRKLSEDDIQRKLYGDIKRPPQEKPWESKTATAFQEPEKASSAPTAPPKPSKKSFHEQASDTYVTVPPDVSPAKGVSGEKRKPWELSQNSSQSVLGGVTIKKSEFKPKPAFKVRIPRMPVPQVKSALQTIGRSLGGFFIATVSLAFQIANKLFRGLYYRREELKKAAVWLAGAGVIFVLFSSVHYLNVKRELAMDASINNRTAEKSAQSDHVVPPVPAEAPSKLTQSEVTPPVNDPAVPKTIASPEVPLAEGKFVVQVATYVGENDAERIVKQLNADGWPSFFKKVTKSGGRNFFPVYLGRFATYQNAQEWHARFKKSDSSQPFQDAFIRTLSE